MQLQAIGPTGKYRKIICGCKLSARCKATLPAGSEVCGYGPVKTHIVLDAHMIRTVASGLDRKLLDFISDPDAGEAEFEQLALELFAYQYSANQPYRNLCDQRNRTPELVRRWTHVPALSAASFADARIACFPPERACLRFVSSGTTSERERASVHELENAVLYDASLVNHFRRCVLPDREKIEMLLLSPSFEDAPQSSLAYMLSRLYERYASGGDFFVHHGSLDSQGIASTLRSAREPVLLFGTAFAFVHFFDYCDAARLKFQVPPGSRIVETGGFKGKSRSIERDEFHRVLSSTFGISPEWCISEYGMCELGSQWYDASLSDKLAGRPPRQAFKVGPHWTRHLVVDPVSAEPLPEGSVGLLQVFDLSNRGSVAAVLTGDLVRGEGEGFTYVSRSQATPPKGCSITVDSMLRSHV